MSSLHKKYKRTLAVFLIGALSGALSLFGIQKVLAASIYNVTETAGTVGQSTTFEIQYTVDTAVQTWANNDTLTLQLPANLTALAPSFALEYDTDTTNNGVGETAINAGISQGQYSYSNPTLSVKWSVAQWGVPVNGASTIRFLITATPVFENANSTFTFGGITAAGGDTNPSGTDTVNIVAADANLSLTLTSNATVGTSGNSVLAFNLGARMTAGDTIVFTAPFSLDVSGVTYINKSFAGLGAFSCAPVGQVVTCTADGIVLAGIGNIVLGGITARHVAVAASVTNFAVNDTDQAGADISSDASGSITDTVSGALTATSLTPSSLVDNQTVSTTVTFTTHVAIPQGGKITVGLPLAWDPSGANGLTAYNLSGLDGTWTAVVVGQVTTLTQTGGSLTAPGVKSFTLDGFKTPVQPGLSTDYSITTKVPGGATIEGDPMIFGHFINPGVNPYHVSLVTPTDLTITDNAEGGVLISWTNTDTHSRFVELLKGVEPLSVNGVPYARIPVTSSSFVDKNVELGDVVHYIVRSGNGKDTSPNSSEVVFVVGSTLSVPTETSSSEVGNSHTDSSTVDSTSGLVPEVVPEEEITEWTPIEAPVQVPAVITFVDTENHWASAEISALAADKVVEGNPDGEFNPEGSLNRAEAAALLSRAYSVEALSPVENTAFMDVEATEWYSPYVQNLYEKGVLDTRLTAYQPSALISQQDFLTLALKVLEHKGLSYNSTVLADTVCPEQVCERGALPITRAEAAELLYALFFQPVDAAVSTDPAVLEE